MCMTETDDYFDYLKGLDADLYGDIGGKINYIAKLYNTDMTGSSSFMARRLAFYMRLRWAWSQNRNLALALLADAQKVARSFL